MLRERLQKARKVLKPPPNLSLPEWADDYRYLSSESSSTPGKWLTARVEAARGPMEAVTDPRVHVITVMCCTQFMKTELILNTIGFFTHQEPSPIIVMQPTIKAGEAFSKDRLDAMFRTSPELKKLMPKKSRDAGNTTLHKQFPGGQITIVGANAPGDLAMRPVRIVLCDEVDKYPGSAGDEGDPVSILAERSATFWNWKQILVCSPTLEPTENGTGSRIAISYEESDKRVFCPQCPHCGGRQEMLWRNVRWPEGEPHKALYHCPDCERPWTETERRQVIKATRFLPNRGWVATAPFNGHAGFKVNKLASPWEPISKLAQKFVKASRSAEMLKVFVNTQLAETWKEQAEVPDWKRLYERREGYELGVVPRGGLIITAGADVQRGPNGDGWIEVVTRAWGRNLENWVIDHQQFHGDTSDLSAPGGPWDQLKEYRERYFPHECTGVAMPIRLLAVDSSDQTQTVYQWCSEQPQGTVIPIKGQATGAVMITAGTPTQIKPNGRRVASSIKWWRVAVNIIKPELYAMLRHVPAPDAPLCRGFTHFPELDQEFFEQLTGEQLVHKRVKGRMTGIWEKTRQRVEVLDCTVYSRAAANLLGLDHWKDENWEALEQELGIVDEDDDGSAQTTQENQRPARRPSTYWNRR